MIRSRKTHVPSRSPKRPRRGHLVVERLEHRTLLSTVTLLNNGPSSNRVDIVFLGDGYTAADIAAGTYRSHVDSMLKHLFADNQDPYPRYRNFFNVHAVEVVSPESGIDNPTQQIWRNTALDATYRCSNVQRVICIDSYKANQAVLAAPVTPEVRLVTTNSDEYGGWGSSFAVYAGGSYASTEIALHELGHSFNGFADEYGGGCATYAGAEPRHANVTKSATGQKWSQWLGYDQPGVGTIGAYSGGLYCQSGIYRPSANSKMRTLGMPFDAVAREKIILDIYGLVDPMDAWLDTSAVRGGDETLWVKVVDRNVIRVEWYVDGKRVAAAVGESFRPSDFRVSRGTHTVTARALDPTDWVRRDRSQLEQSVTWTVNVLTDPPPGPPIVEELQLVTSARNAIAGVELTFIEWTELSRAEMEELANYHLTTPGRDRRFGTSDDRPVVVRSAAYDSARSRLTLTPTKPLSPNGLFQITVDFTPSVTDRTRSPLGADGGGTDNDFAMIIGRGTKLSYSDSDGDVVTLSLARGGVMELTMGPGEQGPRLRLLDTVPDRSVLSGRLKRKRPDGDGVARLQSITGLAGVQNKLAEPGSPFVAVNAAAAIDAMLESDEFRGPADHPQSRQARWASER